MTAWPLHQRWLPSAASLNPIIYERFMAVSRAGQPRRTHLYQGRFENTYLSLEQIPELQPVVQAMQGFAGDILGTTQPLRCGFWFNEMGPGSCTSLHHHDESESLRFQDAKRDHPGQPLRLQARPSFRPEPSGLGGAPEPPDGRLRCITSTMTRRGVAMAFQGYLARCHSLDRTETPLPLLGTTRPALRAPWLAADDEWLSACYYIRVPAASGCFVAVQDRERYQVIPREGLCLLFPPQLLHEVEENRSGAVRLSVAFNFGPLQR